MIKVILLIVLILINGLFSASEIAFLSIDKYELESQIKKGNKKAKKVKKILKNTNSFLATIQVVITFAGFLASALASSTFVDEILKVINVDPEYLNIMREVLIVVVTMILSYLTLIFGELIPKKIGLAHPNKFSYKVVNIIDICNKIFYPFVHILSFSVNVITKMLKIKEPLHDKLTEEKIKKMIHLGKTEGVLEVEETDILLNVFKFNDIEVNEAMTKIDEVIKLDIKYDFKDIFDIVKKEKKTRFPIFDDNKLLGIFNIKDLIINHSNNFEEIIRKPYFVKKHDKIDDVFNLMKDKNIGMVIVGDKMNVEGIITMEDIIEELLGNMEDEFN